MHANDIARFVDGNRLTAISYTTEKQSEVVHPQVLSESDDWYVYVRTSGATKGRIPLSEFVQHMAHSTPGLAIRGIRPSNGRATSISFSQADRLRVSEAFLAFVREQMP